jgi:hypothetical protein
MKFNTAAIEELLTRRFGTTVEVVDSKRLSPWFVARCCLVSQSTEVPASVIVKLLREDPAGFRTDPRQVFTEQVAVEFVGELDSELVPQLWASDRPAGVLILEDLGPRTPLAALLQDGHTAESINGLRRFAQALGRLAAVTAGHEAAYDARLRHVSPTEPQSQRRGVSPEVWSRTRDYMGMIGMEPPSAVEHDMAKIMKELTNPGPFLTLSNGDAGPNNYLISDDDGRLIDFEAAGYRHATEDAVLLHVPGPHWITASDPVAEGTETEFRRALSDVIPQAQDDKRFGAAMAAACLAFAVIRLHRFPKLDARETGDPGKLQLISTLEAAGRAAELHRSLPHLRGWLFDVAEALRQSWPESDIDLATYAPYTPRLQEQAMRPQATCI